MTPAKLRIAIAAMGQNETVVSKLCKSLESRARHFTDISALTEHYAKMVKSCWDAKETSYSEIFAGLGLQPHFGDKPMDKFQYVLFTRRIHAAKKP